MSKIKFSLKGFPTYYFDEDLNLHYSKDRLEFRQKKLCFKKGSYGYKINHRFYSRTGLLALVFRFMKPRNKHIES